MHFSQGLSRKQPDSILPLPCHLRARGGTLCSVSQVNTQGQICVVSLNRRTLAESSSETRRGKVVPGVGGKANGGVVRTLKMDDGSLTTL